MLKDIYWILLFLFPGAIAVMVQEAITGTSGHKKTGFEKTVESIILSIPCLLFIWLILQLINAVWVRCFQGTWWAMGSIEQLKIWLDSLKHIFLYFIASLISAHIIGLIAAAQSRPGSILVKTINALRRRLGKADLSGAPSVWDEITAGREEQVAEIRTKDGLTIKGFIKSSSSSTDKYRELTLHGFDVIEKYQGYFDDKTLVYINLDSGTVITLYDMTAFKEHLERIKELSSCAASVLVEIENQKD